MLMNYKKEIICVLDPMCSWCWGFEPVLKELQKNLPSDIKLSLCMGGLRSKGQEAWTPAFKSYLQKNWQNVHAQTSQAFNLSLLEKKAFDYDTEPACRAVISAKKIDINKQFSFLYALQKAFYQEAKDITDTNVILEIAKQEGFDAKEFLEIFSSEKIKEATLADKYKARSMGANSFPSLVFIDEEGHLYVLKGYKSFDKIKKHL
ncbi:MAG: hypothetical protein COA44_06840 [Arcobacter sp.]|nr:MAG: hypothetical protein COA44_06840 [Arcobacter sp.]